MHTNPLLAAPPASRPVVRNATDSDLPAILAIYSHYVAYELASFELTPPTLGEMADRYDKVIRAGLPWLVADINDTIVGYCYATLYRPRPAYRTTIEESIYLAPGQGGNGVGSALMDALITRCERGPWRQMLAVIAMPGTHGNPASVALHKRFGFAQAGCLRDVGFKQGQWIDTLLMQRPLGVGAAQPADDRHPAQGIEASALP